MYRNSRTTPLIPVSASAEPPSFGQIRQNDVLYIPRVSLETHLLLRTAGFLSFTHSSGSAPEITNAAVMCENSLRHVFGLPPATASESGLDVKAVTTEAVFASAKSLAMFSQYVLKCASAAPSRICFFGLLPSVWSARLRYTSRFHPTTHQRHIYRNILCPLSAIVFMECGLCIFCADRSFSVRFFHKV